jgi:hypothetical protein
MVRHAADTTSGDHDRCDLAQGLVEYALIILLIALALIVTLTVFGTQLGSTYNRITASLAL